MSVLWLVSKKVDTVGPPQMSIYLAEEITGEGSETPWRGRVVQLQPNHQPHWTDE